MLTRIRNAMARHDRSDALLEAEGVPRGCAGEGGLYRGFDVSDASARPGRMLEITMKYTRTATGRSPGSGGFQSRAFGCTPQPTSSPGCSVASEWPCLLQAKFVVDRLSKSPR